MVTLISTVALFAPSRKAWPLRTADVVVAGCRNTCDEPRLPIEANSIYRARVPLDRQDASAP